VPSAGAYRSRAPLATTTITYYNEVPAYTWAVDTRRLRWNSSGAHVQFLKSSRRNAKVLLGIQWFTPAGEAIVDRATAASTARRSAFAAGSTATRWRS
jgi:hypothetical protein